MWVGMYVERSDLRPIETEKLKLFYFQRVSVQVIFTFMSDFLMENVEGTKKKP